MDKQVIDIILSEVREGRADLKELRNDLSDFKDESRSEFSRLKDEDWKLKSKFAIIVVSLGVAGGKLANLIPFLR